MNAKNDLNETTPDITNIDSNIRVETTEDKYKKDGTAVIGFRNPANNTYSVTNNPLPTQIDINKRRQEKKELNNLKKKKALINNDISKEAKKVQSIVAIVVLFLFIGVGAFFYYRKNIANNINFNVKNVHVEFGSPASLKIADYVDIDNPDEKLFNLDLSEFVPDQIGEYKYRISYKGVTKTGKIEVSDTSTPDVVLQEVKLNVGDVYTPEMFIKECQDFNSCIYTFEDKTGIKTASEVGRNTIKIVIKDKVGNEIIKEATLNVKSTDIVLICEKDFGYDYSLGYKTTEKYEVYFSKDYALKNSDLSTCLIYIDNNNYLKFKNQNQTSNYEYDDSLSKVTEKKSYTKGFNTRTDFAGINNYFTSRGYTCRTVLAD